MMNEIKPIETEYNGYRFRSRLEARWAVFFDAMGIKYEYEPEGFDLHDAGLYLPDFRLYVRHRSSTDENEPVYAEVKGVLSPKDEEKITAFSKFYPLILLGNIPADLNEYAKEYVKDNRFFSFRYIDGVFRFAVFSIHKDDFWICGFGDPECGFVMNPMNNALAKARQARFEHGEKPNINENIHYPDRVYKALKFRGYTADQLIQKASLNPSDFSQPIYCFPNISGMFKIAKTLNVSIDWLYCRTDNMEVKTKTYSATTPELDFTPLYRIGAENANDKIPDLRGLADKIKKEMRGA